MVMIFTIANMIVMMIMMIVMMVMIVMMMMMMMMMMLMVMRKRGSLCMSGVGHGAGYHGLTGGYHRR